MVLQLHIIRHPKTTAADGLCYGQTDLPPDATDLQRCAQILDEHCKQYQAVDVLSSPLQRCTALAATLSSSVTLVDEFKELYFGQWENRLWDAIPHSEVNAWRDDLLHTAAPEGETVAAFYRRVCGAAIRLASQPQPAANRHQILVAHGGVIRCFYALTDQCTLANSFALTINYGSVHTFSLCKKQLSKKYAQALQITEL